MANTPIRSASTADKNMDINTTTKYGGSAKESRDGFKIAAKVTGLTQEQLIWFACVGLASTLYRAGASVANEILKVRSNSEAEFSEADAAKLSAGLAKWAKGEDSPLKGGFNLSTTITRHVHGEGQAPVYAEEKKIVARHVREGDVVTWAIDKVGFNGEGELDTENVEFLKAVKAYKQRILAES